MSGGGGSTSGITESLSQAVIPAQISPLISESAANWGQFGAEAAPMMSQLLTGAPEQIPTETPTEANLASQLYGIAGAAPGTAAPAPYDPLSALGPTSIPSGTAAQTDPYNQAAVQQIGALTGGPIGSSPATEAGMQAFKDITLPQVTSGYSSQAGGGGVGGGLNEATSMASEQAAVPLIQQEIANREAAVGQLSGLGQQDIATQLAVPQEQLAYEQAQSGVQQAANQQQLQAYGAQQQADVAQQQQQQADIQAASTAAALPRTIATDQATANYQDMLRVLQGVETGTLGPIQTFGQNLIGTSTTGLNMGGGGGGK